MNNEPDRPPAAANNTKRQIVVVLGMHRSGTSLLANLLHVLGVNLGGDLLAGDGDNEMGYWENERIFRIQDALMNHIAKDWGDYGFVYPFAIDWERMPEFRPFQEELLAIVQGELARAKGLWGFKDPRTCRLLPMWKQIFEELNLEPIYVLAVRNPAVVADSLARRNALDPLHSELVWLLYTLDAIRDAGEDLRIVVDYDRWFTAPCEQARAVAKAVGLEWPEDDRDLVERLAQTIRADLRHSAPRRPCCLPFVAKTYEALKKAAASGQAPDVNVQEELRRSSECLGAALELSAGSGHIALSLGHAELRMGNLEAAVAAYTRATSLQPRLAAAHSSLAQVLEQLGRSKDALESAAKALALDPTDVVALKMQEAENARRLMLQKEADNAHSRQMRQEATKRIANAKQAQDRLFGPNATRIVSLPTITPAPLLVRRGRLASPLSDRGPGMLAPNRTDAYARH